MWQKAILAILTIIIFFFVQDILVSSGGFLAPLSFIMMAVVWLSFISSSWSWWFAILGGWFLDLEQSLMGVNIITFILLVGLIMFLRKRIATTGRLTQFFSICSISLVGGVTIKFILIWLGIKLVPELAILTQKGLGVLISFSQVVELLVFNLLFLLIGYSLFRKKLAI